jgi:hypothetical protein
VLPCTLHSCRRTTACTVSAQVRLGEKEGLDTALRWFEDRSQRLDKLEYYQVRSRINLHCFHLHKYTCFHAAGAVSPGAARSLVLPVTAGPALADLMTMRVMQERRLKNLGLLVRIPASYCWKLQCVWRT